MFIHEIAALAAATVWALTGLVSVAPAKHLGAIAFNRLRMAMVFAMLAVWVTLAGTWNTLTGDVFWPLVWSGVVGIFLGDTALFLTMNRLGPRRTAILFSMNAPMSVVLGWIALGEALSAVTLAGIVVAMTGVVLAIVFGKRKDQLHQWESVTGPLWMGVALGLAAALCQSIGALIARPIMETGAVDAAAASAVRIGVAALCLTVLMQMPAAAVRQANALTWTIAGLTALSGFLAMALGMTFLLFALTGGEVGIITTLSATTPAIMLPLLWWRTREVPAAGAWIGAALVVIGSALIFTG